MSGIPWLSSLGSAPWMGIVLLGAPWVGIIALLVLWLTALARLRRVEGRQQRLMRGVQEGTLPEVLDAHTARLDLAIDGMRSSQANQSAMAEQLSRTVRHVGLVRFNPFADTGGSLSFALVLADSHGDGVVLCNLHGRGESRFYAKPLRHWDSPLSLSEEEGLAVVRARLGEGLDSAGEASARPTGSHPTG
jgi:hypothetical protein